MILRRVGVAAVLTMIFIPASSPAADVTAAGRGTIQIAYTVSGRTVKCSAPLVLGFAVRGTSFAVTLNGGPGSPAAAGSTQLECATANFLVGVVTNAVPGFRHCFPNNTGGIGNPSYTLTQSGATHSIRGTFTRCNGVVDREDLVLTLSASSIVYSHTFPYNGITISLGGTLMRVV